LDDSEQDNMMHECKPCPLGASCKGNIGWSEVKPKNGWWRLKAAEDGQTPPECLFSKENEGDSQPGCAFAECLNPIACLGASNPDRYLNAIGEDLGSEDQIEGCNVKLGYVNGQNCSGNTERCRFCGTCAIGYKRHGGVTKCKKCPPTSTNRALLAVGFLVMMLGSALMVYLTIQEAGDSEDTSESIKKILLNFLQLTSLAAGLPLQWPDSVDACLTTMATISSAGSTLLIPDCELTNIPTADAFYMKQIAFALLVPGAIVFILIVWSVINICCARVCCKMKSRDVKNNTILTIVLMLFLSYPMLTRLTMSALKCPVIGDGLWLMADLQEPCFEDRHIAYVMAVTVPCILVYIVGLPVIAFMIIMRNKHRLEEHNFGIRYGLLYLGYRKNREWWEITIVVRKVAIVIVATFGTLMRAVDLQAFVALLVVFVSIITHLVGKPFDMNGEKSRMLHQLEFVSLACCWITFW